MPEKRSNHFAAELAKQLESDPEYNARREAQHTRFAQLQAETAPLLVELRERGYPLESLGEIREAYAPFPEDVVAALLGWVGRMSDPVLQSQIIRELAHSRAPFDVTVLLRLFESSESDDVRWAIANTLAELRPVGAEEWIASALQNRQYGRAREMLPLALARIAPRDQANRVITEVFEQMPGHAALGLGESGGAEELDFLLAHSKHERGWVKKELVRAIRRIERRLSR